ncbi:PspC domain-containing protein [Nocardioides sp.]|uniref:PspC domain-containing protein n=1 Tax=Nocardioides sp. TaxID=35761 RepID=UPI002BBE1816|nr:PspC domain-containing protein [Nocardioides sp.]HXH77043.1 PspC domain-containing protein [Nocardioides sp.]
MTNPSPPPAAEPRPADRPEQQSPRPTRNDVLDLGRLRRSNHDRRLAGVSAGLARHLDIDPIIVRVTLVVLVFFGGAGLVVYGAVWLLVPEEGSTAQPLGLDDRNRGIALLIAGIVAALAGVGDSAGAFWFPWPFVLVALGIVWFLNRKDQGAQPYVPPVSGYGAPMAGSWPTTSTTTDPATTGAEQPAWASQSGPVPTSQYQPYQPYQQSYLPYDPASYSRPRNPRKKGPILFWFTLALIATGIGTLGLIDVSGNAVPDAAYPALSLALTGLMLVLGAFWGRAGGLIFIGLVLSAATLAATATSNYVDTTLSYTPTSSTEVRELYTIDGGELSIDLSQVEDVEGLDGHELRVEGGVGEIEVIVPDGMDVTAAGTTGVGDVSVFERRNDGLDVTVEELLDRGDDVPDMNIFVDLGVGEITIREK